MRTLFITIIGVFSLSSQAANLTCIKVITSYTGEQESFTYVEPLQEGAAIITPKSVSKEAAKDQSGDVFAVGAYASQGEVQSVGLDSLDGRSTAVAVGKSLTSVTLSAGSDRGNAACQITE